ncbi:IclR family transcriptional regulator [Halosimplex aquaticum]|uniref:IclR family transcriptional regulator n=1 Tax=Halosimplex aquaticum TaxID=3026162 RepID=A0ABD5Y1F5_9EURY|nr:IclR family transcriptional regulator [Halosimplex aquaticum]
MTPDDGKTVQTAVTSFEILEGIRELDGAGPTALADHLDRSKSGVYKHVRTLADRGYLVEDGGEYRLGLGMWTLGAGARSEYPVEAGRRTVDSLVASVGHVASLVVYENGVASSVYRERPGADVDTVGSLGDSLPLHATAAGKAVLAHLPDTERRTVLDEQPLTEHTAETITDTAALTEELESVRGQRTATELEEYREGVHGVASPVLDEEGIPIGAVYVTGPPESLSETRLEAKISGLVVSASRSVENALSTDSD